MLSQTDVDDNDGPTMIFIGICHTVLFPMNIRLFLNVFIFENRCHTKSEEMQAAPTTQYIAFKSVSALFQKEVHPKSYPLIEEPNEELVLPIAKKRKRCHKSKFNESDLRITDSVVAQDADRKSAEYREKIWNHFDKLKLKFLSLTCADYARANRSRFKERTFQKWCSTTRRAEDRKKIKLKTESKPESAFRRGYKDINKAERTRFTNAEKYGFILEWENAERENPDITTVEFCSTKPKLSGSTFRNWLTDNQ